MEILQQPSASARSNVESLESLHFLLPPFKCPNCKTLFDSISKLVSHFEHHDRFEPPSDVISAIKSHCLNCGNESKEDPDGKCTKCGSINYVLVLTSKTDTEVEEPEVMEDLLIRVRPEIKRKIEGRAKELGWSLEGYLRVLVVRDTLGKRRIITPK